MVSSSRIMWGTIFVILLATIMWQWNKMEPEVENTALIMTSRDILSSANEYRNYWVVSGEPASIQKEGINVQFSALGWPIVFNDGKLDCRAWLTLLLPEKKTIYTDSITITHEIKESNYNRCNYGIADGKMISVMLINDIFKVNVIFSETK